MQTFFLTMSNLFSGDTSTDHASVYLPLEKYSLTIENYEIVGGIT